MSILSQLFSNYGDDLARQFVDHADDAVLAGIRNYSDDAMRAAANQSDDMIKLYRGISAENEDLLNQYVDEMFDPNIKPTTHSGGSAYGEGYYFTPSKDLAEYYAHKNGDPYYAIASVEVPKKKFTRLSAELGNRPADFDLAAIKRGVPENIRYQTGINDFNNYIDDNGFWGTLSNGENPNYIVMRNDALKNMDIIDGNYNKNLLNKLTNDDIARSTANQTDDLARLATPKRANVPLNQRLSGDSLLDAQDLIDEVKGVGGTVDDFGNVRLYHRTNPESAQKIMDSGKMFGKEDGLFFSTAKNGANNSAYGNTPISFDIPAENLLLDDIFGDEASIRMPLQRAGQFADVSGFVNNPQKTALQSLISDDGITPIYRGQKYGVNDLLYNKNGGGAAGAGKTPSISNAYYFTPNAKKTVNWTGENGGTIKIPMRNDDVITLQQLQDMIAEADPIFADPRKALDLYNTNPTKYDLMEAVADRQYRTISELTKKPFIQPDSGQGEELMETLFFPDTNPTLTDIYRELLHRSGGKTN